MRQKKYTVRLTAHEIRLIRMATGTMSDALLDDAKAMSLEVDLGDLRERLGDVIDRHDLQA